MTQWVKLTAIKPGDLSLILGTHLMGRRELTPESHTDLLMGAMSGTCMPTYIHTHTH